MLVIVNPHATTVSDRRSNLVVCTPARPHPFTRTTSDGVPLWLGARVDRRPLEAQSMREWSGRALSRPVRADRNASACAPTTLASGSRTRDGDPADIKRLRLTRL